MEKIQKIRKWLEGDQNYFQGIELYNAYAYGGRRIFPIQPTCAQYHNMLKAELESILKRAKAEEASISDLEKEKTSLLKDELMAANLDKISWPETKSLFSRLKLQAASNLKIDIMAALKTAQSQLKHQNPA